MKHFLLFFYRPAHGSFALSFFLHFCLGAHSLQKVGQSERNEARAKRGCLLTFNLRTCFRPSQQTARRHCFARKVKAKWVSERETQESEGE